MSVQLEVIEGFIELRDEFTGKLGLAEAALGQFTKHNQESLKATAEAVGIVTVAVVALTSAVVALGNRGSEVNEVSESLQHFAGSAEHANDIMQQLRAGTKGTVDDFTLMKDATHLLSTGVKLTSDDFGTLAEAAFVLKGRGLGGTKEQLELVSDALVTGRTRALAMSVGVLDAGDAEEKFAAKLGVTKEQLSDTGKVEAKRIAVLDILNRAVKDAGETERSFADEILAARTAVSNWFDQIAKAVAVSPVLKAGLMEIEKAVHAAFGGDNQDSIKSIVHWIEQAAIVAVNFGLGVVETARVMNVAWSLVKTLVLGTVTAIVVGIESIADAITVAANIGEHFGVVPEGTAEKVLAVRDSIGHMTDSLIEQTAEAAKGVIGQSEFDKTLDRVGGALMNVKDAMIAASNETDKHTKVTDIAAENAKKLQRLQEDLSRSMIDRVKIEAELWKIEEKSIKETEQVWNEYFLLRAEHGTSSFAAQKAAIDRWFDDEVTKLDASDRNWQNHYDALKAVADEKLRGIEIDWQTVQDKSIDSLQHTAEVQRNTYNEMLLNATHYTRDALDEQLKKTQAAEDAARGWGATTKTAINDVVSTLQLLDHSWVTDADVAAETINRTTIMVKTLTGEIISLTEAQKRQQSGGMFDVTSQNFEKSIRDVATSFGWNPAGFGSNIDYAQALKWAHMGYSFQEILNMFANMKAGSNGPIPPPQGPRIPGFAQGGTVMVGEDGPEIVRLPLGSRVFPNGVMPSGDVIHYHNWQINGSAVEVAQKVKQVIMKELKSQRQFGAA